MANKEHLAILKQGVDVWNHWRNEHPKIRPDLYKADLSGVDLSEANLGSYLRGDWNLMMIWGTGVDLSEASLREAKLIEANLRAAKLRGADLKRANLNGSNMSQTSLREADLRGADLRGADLREADLSGVDLSEAMMSGTILNELNLRHVKGLETVYHGGPSDIGIQTIYKSQGQIPEVFLRGAGVPETFIEYMRSLVVKPIEYYSCFISHSSKDHAFCQRLYNDLQGARVRCWLDSEDLKIGDKFWERIDESIRLHDKLLVVLSEHSIASDWVEDEVMRALEKERPHPGHTVLFPIHLDDAVMRANKPWANSIKMKRHIGDFSHWKDHDAYQEAFARLLRDLQQADDSAPPPTGE